MSSNLIESVHLTAIIEDFRRESRGSASETRSGAVTTLMYMAGFHRHVPPRGYLASLGNNLGCGPLDTFMYEETHMGPTSLLRDSASLRVAPGPAIYQTPRLAFTLVCDQYRGVAGISTNLDILFASDEAAPPAAVPVIQAFGRLSGQGYFLSETHLGKQRINLTRLPGCADVLVRKAFKLVNCKNPFEKIMEFSDSFEFKKGIQSLEKAYRGCLARISKPTKPQHKPK
jgi:hypothetical protein